MILSKSVVAYASLRILLICSKAAASCPFIFASVFCICETTYVLCGANTSADSSSLTATCSAAVIPSLLLSIVCLYACAISSNFITLGVPLSSVYGLMTSSSLLDSALAVVFLTPFSKRAIGASPDCNPPAHHMALLMPLSRL